MAYLKKKKQNRFSLLLLFVAITVVFGGCGPKASPQLTYEDTEKVPDPIYITGISATEDVQGKGAVVHIEGSRMLTYTSVKQSEPLGIVFYFPDTALDEVAAIQTPESNLITKISASELATNDKTVRLEIGLSHDSTYTVNRDENGLQVTFPTSIADIDNAYSENTEPLNAMDEETPHPMEVETANNTQENLKAAPATELSGISTETEESHATVHVQADGTISDYVSFALPNPPRIVYDLKNIKSPYTTQQTITVDDSPWIKKVRYYAHPDKIRLVLETNGEDLSAYNASATNTGLTIQVGSDISPASVTPPVYMAEASGPSSDGAPSGNDVARPEGWVNRIDFAGEADGKSTVLIGTTEPAEYTLEKTGDDLLQLRLFHTKLPDYRERPLVTTRFESAVDRVTPYRQNSVPNDAFFNIELRESVPYFVEQKGALLMVHFEASSVPPQPLEETALPSWQATSEQIESISPATKTNTAMAAAASSTSEESFRGYGPKYSGEKIALDFYETDIKNVFRILREVSGKNFAIDKDVTGTVTLSFDQPVPWDQVLDLILRMNQLGQTMDGNIVRIATLDTLKKEETDRQAALLAAQKSQETELALAPLRTEYIAINYSNAKNEILPHIKSILTEGRGQAEVDERSNLIVITDTDRIIAQAKTIVRRLDKVTPQVIIEARVVEVNSDVSNELGIDWNLSSGPVTRGELGGAYSWDVAMNFPSESTSALGFKFDRVAGTPLVIDAQLNALETQSKGKVISTPKIVTLDNKKATIKQGYEVGYYERDDSGGSSTKFKSVDLLLEVTPHVTPDRRVSMTVYITKNDIQGTFNNAPLLATNEADTEFLVNDGETIVIGGILKKSEQYGEEGFPILKKIPGIKWLFSNEKTTETKQELLIFITPKIVTLSQREVL